MSDSLYLLSVEKLRSNPITCIMLRNYLKSTQALLTGFSSGEKIDEKNELRNVFLMLLALGAMLMLVILVPEQMVLNYSVTELIFFVFFFSGLLCLILAVWVVFYDYKHFEKVKEIIELDVASKLNLTHDDLTKQTMTPEFKRFEFQVATLLGDYYAPLIHKIMNIGVVPIILGIIALILSDLTSTEAYIGEINITTALLLIGGTMEALAFILGFMFPEGSTNKHLSEITERKNNHETIDEEMMKRILLAVMPEVQKGINETFKQMSIETSVTFSDKSRPNSSASSTNN